MSIELVCLDMWFLIYFYGIVVGTKEEFPTAKKMPIKMETSDYTQAVIDSVEKEYAAYRDGMTKKSPDEVFGYNYEIHTYTELYNVICDYDYLTDKDYRALYEERGHILDLLYDDFKSVDGALSTPIPRQPTSSMTITKIITPKS